jgi:hypothetical protein
MYDQYRFDEALEVAREQLEKLLRRHHFPLAKMDSGENPLCEEFCYSKQEGVDEFTYTVKVENRLKKTDQNTTSVRFKLVGHAIYTTEKRFRLQIWLNDIHFSDKEEDINAVAALLKSKNTDESAVWAFIHDAHGLKGPKNT